MWIIKEDKMLNLDKFYSIELRHLDNKWTVIGCLVNTFPAEVILYESDDETKAKTFFSELKYKCKQYATLK